MPWVGGALPCVVQVQGLLFCGGRGGLTTGASRTGTTQKNSLAFTPIAPRSFTPTSLRPSSGAGRPLARSTDRKNEGLSA